MLGPYTWNQLQSFSRDQLLSPDDLLKGDQMPEWLPSGHVSGLPGSSVQVPPVAVSSAEPSARKKKKTLTIVLVSLLALLLVSLAAFFLIRFLSADPQLQILSVTASIGVDEQNRPVGETAEFSPDTEEIFVSAQLAAVSRPAVLRAVWIWESGQYEIGWYDLPLPRGSTAAVFSFTKPDQGWPAGDYRVELRQGERFIGTIRFQVFHEPVMTFDFQDEFISFDPTAWMVVRGTSSNLGYGGQHDDTAYRISGEQMILVQDVVDDGPFLHSMPFSAAPGDVVTITRQVLIQPANDKLLAGMTLFHTDDPALSSTFTDPLITVQYLYYNWDGATHQGDWDCFLFNERKWDDDRKPLPLENPLAPVWGAWFTEVIVYDTRTNQAEYYLNGEKVAAAPALNPFDGGYMKLVIIPYGWQTGHLTSVNMLSIVVTPADTPAR